MKRTQWLLLALAEIVVAAVVLIFARSVLFIPLKIVVTALRRWDVFQPNAAYFMGMFFWMCHSDRTGTDSCLACSLGRS